MSPYGRFLDINDLYNDVITITGDIRFTDRGQKYFVDGNYYGKVEGNAPTAYQNYADQGLTYVERVEFGKITSPYNLGTCAVLDTPLEKDETMTLKVTYKIGLNMP